MKRTLKLTVMAFVAMSMVALAACKKDDPKPQGTTPGTDNPGTTDKPSATITFDSSSYLKAVSDKDHLIKFTVEPADVKYKIEFSNEGVVTKNGEGYVPARVGNTVMTVRVDDDRYKPKSEECHICVVPQLPLPTMPTPGDFVTMGQSFSWGKKYIGAADEYSSGTLYKWADTKADGTTPYYDSSTGKYTKYYEGDSLRQLDNMDDAAYVVSNGEWRMPTKEEAENLINKCAWVYTEIEGHGGFMVIAPSNNRIFLPAENNHDISIWTKDVYEIQDYAGAYYIFAAKVSGGACEVRFQTSKRSISRCILPIK